MAKKNVKNKLSGADGFEQYYSDLFKDRWIKLRTALLESPHHIEWNAGGVSPYFLDSGSVLAALSLPLGNDLSILDMCAAPGGKTLVLASRMDANSHITSNERSIPRKARLSRVIEECLSEDVRNRITVTGFDAAKWCCHETETFDRILLDAPCSSERHVLSDPKYLAEWSPSRIKTLAIAQWALVSSAFRVLKTGGYMMYSTCALSPDENDAIVERLCKKFPNTEVQVEICPDLKVLDTVTSQIKIPGFEKTEYGFHVLPDTQEGAGPLFFTIVQKK